jgi:hypothetical protein
MDQSDWQDESRNSGRQIKLPFMKPEVSSPTHWVNPFNSTFPPAATLMKMFFLPAFPNKILYTFFIPSCELAQHVTPF